MAKAWVQQATGQHDGMDNQELLRGVLHYALAVQAPTLLTGTEAGSQASPGRLFPFDPQDPCDDAMIDDILQKHHDGFARLARR